jgi:hypothetical protein
VLSLAVHSKQPDQLWGLHSLPFKRYRVSSCRGMKLTTRLRLVQMSRASAATLPLPYTPSWHATRQVSLCIQWESNPRNYDWQMCLVKDCMMGFGNTIYCKGQQSPIANSQSIKPRPVCTYDACQVTDACNSFSWNVRKRYFVVPVHAMKVYGELKTQKQMDFDS